ncbi:MAG: hypothetical protein AAFX65_00470 [Cyanobacteria bacterium J06638_7]
MAEPALSGPTSQLLSALTGAQRRQLARWQAELEDAPGWQADLPVVLLERCWLRLRAVTVATLGAAVPADTSAEAPELTRWRQLIDQGSDPWCAQVVCWQEFGAQACQRALHRHWQQQDRQGCGWTFADYLQLLRDYREALGVPGGRRLPLLVLRRPEEQQRHHLHWLPGQHRTMRHTCA